MPDSALRDTPLARSASGLDACVHCGFCLTACPTYLALDDENESPRGRLVLMRALLDGEIVATDAVATAPLDRCLGCRACETACPSGVPYGQLLEAARATIVARRPLPWRARAILFVFARPALLRVALWCARAFRATGIPRLLGRIAVPSTFPFAMLASTARPARADRHTPPDRTARAHAGGTAAAGTVALLTGCVMEGLLAPVNRATERALDARGFTRVPVPSQRCCGALHAHAGDAGGARALARANIAAFEAAGASAIAVNSAGCGSMLKEYAHLFAPGDPWHERAARVAARVRDISELLTEREPPDTRRTGEREPIAVAYDAPCHLHHAQRITEPPVALLRGAPGITLVPLSGSEHCCGSAGIYNLIEPGIAGAVLRPKLAAIAASGAAVVVTGNPGCLMQIGAGLLREGSGVQARHPVEFVG